MLFSEIYGSYFTAVAEIIKLAVEQKLDNRKMLDCVNNKAFSESMLVIPDAIKSGTWPLVTKDHKTPIRNVPQMPLTLLQKRWLKSLLADPRIKLFGLDGQGLDDVEPLFLPDFFVYYDRYNDGDNFEDSKYIRLFRSVLQSIYEKREVLVGFISHRGVFQHWRGVVCNLEYSAKDDKFRIEFMSRGKRATINLSRVVKCKLLEPYDEAKVKFKAQKEKTLVFDLTDERNGLERAMLHFSHFEKQTERLDNKHYRVTLKYGKDDEPELLIRLMSFGEVIKVISPATIAESIKNRIEKQLKLRT